MNKLKSIYVSAYSACASIIVVIIMTIGTELSVPFKAWLASFTGHHWVTKSWVSLIIFGLMFALISLTHKSVDQNQTKKSLAVLEASAVLGFIIILGFYVYEFWAH